MEKQNNQLEHGQPMEQTRGLLCTCDSGVARCQSKHQCHFWLVLFDYSIFNNRSSKIIRQEVSIDDRL